MNKATILDALNHAPRKSKIINLSDGTALPISHPDQLVFPSEHLGGIRACVLWQPDGGFRVIDVDHIVSIQVPK